jgi:hypothetical protein
MKLRMLSSPLWAAALLHAASAGAAPPEEKAVPERNGDIVVTGTRDMEGQVRDFVGALTVTSSGGQLTRFEAAICPAALGVSASAKQALAARIRTIAKAAGIAVGKAGCTPNVLLVVTPDKAGFIDALSRKHPDYFGKMSAREIRKLAAAPGPAAVWHVDGPPVDADGAELGDKGDGIYLNRTTRSGSRLTAAARPQFGAAAVVVEAKALDGLTTTQLADYAAMRAFSRSDPSRLPGTGMGEEVPITLTAWDLAFLRSLYAAPANISAAAQRFGIRRGVEKQLEERE